MHKFWHIKVWHVFTFIHNYQFLDSNHFLFVYIVYPGTRIFIYLKYFIIGSGSFSTTSPSSEQSSTWSPCYHVSVVQSVQSTDRFIWTRKSVVCIPSSSPSSANKLTYTDTHTHTHAATQTQDTWTLSIHKKQSRIETKFTKNKMRKGWLLYNVGRAMSINNCLRLNSI